MIVSGTAQLLCETLPLMAAPSSHQRARPIDLRVPPESSAVLWDVDGTLVDSTELGCGQLRPHRVLRPPRVASRHPSSTLIAMCPVAPIASATAGTLRRMKCSRRPDTLRSQWRTTSTAAAS